MEAPPPPRKPELFHAIADAGSAAARRLVVELGLEDALRLRNLAYPEVEADFAARGGTRTPALWDDAILVEGEDAVVAALRRIAGQRALASSSG
jgi:hypothetical protein